MDDRQAYAERLVDLLGLIPLPKEGGSYVESYRSADVVRAECLPERYVEERPFGTAIFYLYNDRPDSFSALHTLPTDDIYHFYLGDPVEMLLLYPGGKSERLILGQDLFSGQRVQTVVPRGVWQGSRLLAGGVFALIGTTMAPGWVDSDYTGGRREDLIRRYPQQASLIRFLTRE